jgi:hypothetical protein
MEGDDMAFELVEFCEPVPQPGTPFAGTSETVVATYDAEAEAIAHGRRLWRDARVERNSDVMWWIVRVPGESLARWIADKGSDVEQILDLTTNELVPVP